MVNKTSPALAVSLAAAASSRLRLEEREAEFGAAFVPAVAAMDDADGLYRHAVEAAAPVQADAILAAMRGFRERVAGVRAQTRETIAELYRRSGRVYGAFDPLDSYVPPTDGLSHADATRVAAMGDAARGQVNALRAQVNEDVLQRLAPGQIDELIAAKRRRRDAFEAALRRALEAVVVDPTVTREEIDKALYQLVQLADGWY
jgi:hypothetical protein